MTIKICVFCEKEIEKVFARSSFLPYCSPCCKKYTKGGKGRIVGVRFVKKDGRVIAESFSH